MQENGAVIYEAVHIKVPGGEQRGVPEFSPCPSASWLRQSQSESLDQALNNGDTAMGAGAALQGWLGLHLSTAGVKGEDPISALPMIIPPPKDVDLSIAHCYATALLEGQQKNG